MNVTREIAEARATALFLRAAAHVCGPDQGPLKFRLVRAAEALDGMVGLVVRGLDRIEELGEELCKHKAGDSKGGAQ